jgi:hypothetical protein
MNGHPDALVLVAAELFPVRLLFALLAVSLRPI